LLVLMAATLSMSPSVADPDLWGHVQFGRDAIASGWFPETTSYSYTAEGFRWINHENLSELTMATVVDFFGTDGLLWGRVALTLIVLGSVLWCNARQGVGLMVNSIVTLLVAANLGYHWSFRPQISSYFLFALMVLILQFCFAGWRNQWHLRWSEDTEKRIEQSWFQGRMLWLLVPLIFVWTNSHGGFVAGVCIAVAYLGLRAFEALIVNRSEGWGLVRRLSLIAAALVAMTFVNPYSYELPVWLFNALSVPRPEIYEWSNSQLWTLVGAKFWALTILFAFAYACSRKQRDFVQMCILGLTMWQAFSHFRHVPFFTILCGYWLGPHLESALQRFQPGHQKADYLATGKGQYNVGRVAVLAIVVISFSLSSRLERIQVKRDEYPVDAFTFMHENKVHGRMVVTFDWAQYAVAAFCADDAFGNGASQIAFDGRFRTCYPQEVIDMHFDFLYGVQDQIPRFRADESQEVDPDLVLEFGEPEIVVIRRMYEVTSSTMSKKTDRWCLLYRDGMAEVWGIRERFDNPESNDYISPSDRVLTDVIPSGIVNWPALPQSSESVSSAIVF
ncbi:MAG: hypothetical protein AAGA30_19775, partial [Planctomycetota bacterium]